MKKFNIDKYVFNKLVSNLFEVDDLTKLHKLRNDLLPTEHLNLYTESSTKFHSIFYSKLNDHWSDGDPLHKHPPGEINFFLPLTKCYGTNTMWVESEPWKLDFKPIELDYGEYFMFNGNQCHHGNKPNKTNLTRISFDFRIMPVSKYDPTWNVDSPTSHTKFVVGEYYKELYK